MNKPLFANLFELKILCTLEFLQRWQTCNKMRKENLKKLNRKISKEHKQFDVKKKIILNVYHWRGQFVGIMDRFFKKKNLIIFGLLMSSASAQHQRNFVSVCYVRAQRSAITIAVNRTAFVTKKCPWPACCQLFGNFISESKNGMCCPFLVRKIFH